MNFNVDLVLGFSGDYLGFGSQVVGETVLGDWPSGVFRCWIETLQCRTSEKIYITEGSCKTVAWNRLTFCMWLQLKLRFSSVFLITISTCNNYPLNVEWNLCLHCPGRLFILRSWRQWHAQLGSRCCFGCPSKLTAFKLFLTIKHASVTSPLINFEKYYEMSGRSEEGG